MESVSLIGFALGDSKYFRCTLDRIFGFWDKVWNLELSNMK